MTGVISSPIGACGIPYFVSDIVADVKELMKTPVGVVRDVSFFKKVKGVDVVTGTEAVGIDREDGKVHLVELATSRSYSIDYDRLILATGSSPSSHPWIMSTWTISLPSNR